MSWSRFIVLTGLSGSGKSQAIRALEDLGYYCVDNLPVSLLPVMAELSERQSEHNRVAVVMDVRESRFVSDFPRVYRQLKTNKHLRSKLIEPMAKELRDGRRLRIWSAGCSSGQEPYSIALSILSVLPDARAYDARILATDINPLVLETGRKATYPAEEAASLPADLRRSWMESTGTGTLRFDEAPRGLITFRQLNLLERWPMKGPFDVVFFRNVLIYFDIETQRAILDRMHGLIADDGLLYAGHSENLTRVTDRFALMGQTIYRKIGKGQS